MKTALAFASLLAVTASAFAVDPYPKARFDDGPSQLTREQVQAEAAAARARGELDEAARYRGPAAQATGAPKTRAQVQAELQAARDSGQWRAGLESAYGGVSPYAERAAAPATSLAGGRQEADSATR